MNERTDINITPDPGFDIEPERYEFFEGPAYHFDLDRRGFLKAIGGGILVLCLLDREAEDAEAQPPGSGRRRGGFGGPAAPRDLGAWLHIGEDGKISVYTGKAEVGQNIRTSLSQVVAEELHVPVESIHMVMADTQLTPYDMGTFGSRTTPGMSPQLRRAAAAARELLIDLAADNWKADRAELTVIDGAVVRGKTRETLPFGKLTQGKKLTKTVSDEAPTTPAADWKVAGQPVAKVDGRAFVTGKHQYASDVRLPGMWHGKVLRPPSYGAKLTGLDTTAARAMRDVVVVRDGDFVGVAAPSEFQATRALAALKAEWKPGPAISGKDLFTVLKQPARPGQGGRGGGGGGYGGSSEPTGSIDAGLKAADVRLKQSYTIAYIAHAPLEPRAAVATWEDGKLTVWTGSQGPFRVRGELMGAFGLSENAARVIVPDTGSGYGGKHTVEAAVEAARLAREAGRPVKVVWTREEEFTWAYFRPAGVIDVVSGVKKDGTLTAWEFHNYNSGQSAIRSPYQVPNQVASFHPSNSPLRPGSYRALAATANHFARESHMDELAHAIGLDPLDFRLKNLGKTEQGERLRAVLEAAAKAFGWGRKPATDHGFGLALGSDKGGYVATCAEVSVDRSDGRVQVVRAVSAFECGAVINPDHLKNQVEGALIMGLGGAMTEAIAYEDGKILNPKFSKYRVPRFRDAPEIEVVLLDRKDLPSAGAGETPIVGIAPAVGNAIFNAVGVRLRSMPMVPQGLKL
jgi:isoquinoline 1-oxidoreductase